MKTLLSLLTEYPLITSCAVTATGIFLVWRSNKQRNEAGEWSNALQWGYLIAMLGIFAFLNTFLEWSFTASLLAFTAFTGAVWLWRKFSYGRLPENIQSADTNHFRDYIGGFFPLIAVIFVLRTFIAEPFQIPSSSMRPGLVKGDFILVNKFAYGIRVPVLNRVAIETGKIERGDIVVFNYPADTKLNYIKRIVAVPGDTVEYRNKTLTINGVVEDRKPAGTYSYPDDQNPNIRHDADRFHTTFSGKNFDVLSEQSMPSFIPQSWIAYQKMMEKKQLDNGLKQNCAYAPDGSAFKCTVPQGRYFAMGDNRDSSADSRYWGFIDDSLIVGKASFIWLNIGDMKRIGTSIR